MVWIGVGVAVETYFESGAGKTKVLLGMLLGGMGGFTVVCKGE